MRSPLSDRYNALYGTSEFHGAMVKGVVQKPQCCISRRGYPERHDTRWWDKIILAHPGVAPAMCIQRLDLQLKIEPFSPNPYRDVS